MKKVSVLTHEFVEYIPNELDEAKLYVSLNFGTVAHKCFCGCGSKVITPLSPTDWQLTFDGVSISLYPSIGSWNLPCRSHYWIKNNKVTWARRWSDQEIQDGQLYDKDAKEDYYQSTKPPVASDANSNFEEVNHTNNSFWEKFKKRWF